jgi:hypothetical protein
MYTDAYIMFIGARQAEAPPQVTRRGEWDTLPGVLGTVMDAARLGVGARRARRMSQVVFRTNVPQFSCQYMAALLPFSSDRRLPSYHGLQTLHGW